MGHAEHRPENGARDEGRPTAVPGAGLGPESRQLLGLLEENSPQSTRSLRAEADLTGKPLEAVYARALKELWTRLLIVGTGEVDDGAFPSLAIGATKLLFEDLWATREESNADDARFLDSALAGSPAFARFFKQLRAQPRGA